MKRTLLITLALVSTFANAQTDTTQFMRQLMALPGINDVTVLKSSCFNEKYAVTITQNVDGETPAKGTFQQRLFIGFKDFNQPTVIVTEGYEASYAKSPNYKIELCDLFDANVIVCEYRYFAESTPTPCNYDYLTVENSLRDLHNVRQTFGQLLKGKWIATGTSKGGMTTMFYRTFYPNDVDVSVPYVAPLNSAVEDGRHEPFIAKQVGTKAERKAVKKIQDEMMKRKEAMLPLFQEYCKEHNYQFYIPLEDVYDYCVFEYSFAYWQYKSYHKTVPSAESDNENLLHDFIGISGPDYFAHPNSFYSFDIQAARELGYYGYDLKPFKKKASVTSTHGYLSQIMLSPETRNIQFSADLYNRTVDYLKNNDPTMLFIYGEDDPWSASGVCSWLDTSHKHNMKIYVQPHGDHGSCINDMPTDMKQDIIDKINSAINQ